ncbi:hypothetical protein FQR65_LT07873 [Abscondita terminalis]|nr:hypothetical protein FQR65_LT07873 [Abscondita terminalis]
MYKIILLVLFGTLIQGNAEDLKETIIEIIKECISEKTINQEGVKNSLRKPKTPKTDVDFMNAFDCYLYRSEIIKNDEINVDRLRFILLPILVQLHFESDRRTSEELIKNVPEECFKVEKVDPPLLEAVKIRDCIIQSIYDALQSSNVQT